MAGSAALVGGQHCPESVAQLKPGAQGPCWGSVGEGGESHAAVQTGPGLAPVVQPNPLRQFCRALAVHSCSGHQRGSAHGIIEDLMNRKDQSGEAKVMIMLPAS